MQDKDAERLLQIVSGKVLHGEFTLTSGEKSAYYFDGRLITLSAEGAYLVGKKVFELVVAAGAEAIGGPTLGADPIIGSVIAISWLEGKPVSGLIVRGETKTHGTQKLIEGNLPQGGKVAIVDDVITTGGSFFRAIEAVEKGGCQVVKVIALLDRQQGGSEELRKKGYDFTALLRADASGAVYIN